MTPAERFSLDISNAIYLYPYFKKVKHLDGNYSMLGFYNVIDDEGELRNTFVIDIRYRIGYPYVFPELFEISGKIPKVADWHINEIGSCCITVPLIEKVACKNGINIIDFIHFHAKPYLFNQAYRLHHGFYAGEEFSHGILGIWECYYGLFSSTDKVNILHNLIELYIMKTNKSSLRLIDCTNKAIKCQTEAYRIFKDLNKDFLLSEIKRLYLSLPKHQQLEISHLENQKNAFLRK